MRLSTGRTEVCVSVGCRLPSHHRALAIPRERRAAALGVHLAASCYSRFEELDGWCPAVAIEDIASDEMLADLLGVGLFVLEERGGLPGYLVVGFAKFNETKSEIDKRLKADRNRKKPARIPTGFQPDSDRIPDQFLRNRGEGEGEGSLSVFSGSSPGERERVAGAAEREVGITDQLTDELRAIASGATGGTPVQAVDDAWRKFCGHYAGKWLHVPGKWQQWCVTEAKRERGEREAARESGVVVVARPVSAKAQREREEARGRAEAADRLQTQRAEQARSRGNVEPLAMGGGKRT